MSANFDVNVIFSIYAQLGKLEKHTSLIFAAQKMKFYIKDPFSKCNQTWSFLLIWSHLLKKSLMENFTFVLV